MDQEVSIYDTRIMSSTPTYQSDYAPDLSDPQVSSEEARRRRDADSISYD